MKVNAINQSLYINKNTNLQKGACANNQNISKTNCSINPSFQGSRGKLKGGAYGALAALIFTGLFGQGFVFFPFLTVGGALVGHKLEEEKLEHDV